MIQVTAIPDLNPYHRLSPIADFTACPTCQQTYQPGIRLAICPHPIIAPRRLFPADTQIAIRHRNRPKGIGKRLPLILEEPFWFLQDNEDPLRHEGLQIYLAGGPGSSLMDVVRKWQKERSFVYRIAKEDKWEIRRHAYFREEEVVKQVETQRIIKKDTADMLKVVRGSLRLCSIEVARLLRAAESGRGQAMTHAELDKKIETQVKLYRLLQEQSTEIISVDTPEMKHERHLRACAEDIKFISDEERTEGLGEDRVMENRGEYIRLLAGRYQLEEEEVSAAVDQLDRIEQQSESVS